MDQTSQASFLMPSLLGFCLGHGMLKLAAQPQSSQAYVCIHRSLLTRT